jgi:hypothetical protein
MRTLRRFWIGLIGVAAVTLAGGCSEDQVTSPTTNGDPPESPEPPHVLAPAPPTGVSATVLHANGVWVSWTPGARTSSQIVVLSNVDGLEPDRIKELAFKASYQVTFAGLQWGASYRVVVTAVNEAGRAESDPVSFEIPIPDPPVLTWFSATRDPTCLTVEWTASEPATGHRVEVTGATEASSFEETVHPRTDAVFCAIRYPIVDGMTYAAQVFAILDGLELESDIREFTVDFDPEYSLNGVWRGGSWVFGQYWPLTVDLVDVDGDISGTWTDWRASGRATGTRVGTDLELTLDGRGEYDGHLSGDLDGPDRIEGMIWPGLVYTVRLERD